MSDWNRVNGPGLDYTWSDRASWPSNTQQDIQSYIGDDGDVCDELHNGKPDANVLSSLNHRAPILSHKLLSVQSDFHPVVDESKERRQRARRHKDGDEAKLDHC